MKRYYLSPMVQLPGPGGRLVWAPQVAHMLMRRPNTAVSVMGPTVPAAGTWALVIAETPSHVDTLADTTSDALPDLTLDTPLSVLTAQQRNLLLNRLGMRGIDTAGMGVNTPFREVIRAAGRVYSAQFDENGFDATL